VWPIDMCAKCRHRKDAPRWPRGAESSLKRCRGPLIQSPGLVKTALVGAGQLVLVKSKKALWCCRYFFESSMGGGGN